MTLHRLISIAPLVLILFSEKALSIGDFGPDTCMEGFVWREACGQADHVCVPSATRDQARLDNQAASSRISPTDKTYGPDTCKPGFVWREACGPADHVCVSVEARSQATADNQAREARRKYPYCRSYALDAVNANQVNQLYRCSLDGNRWQSNEANHFNWCLHSPDRDIGGERFARYKELDRCSSSAGKLARAGKSFPDSPPSGPPGSKCCVVPGGVGPDGKPIGSYYTCGPQCP
jgi:hypothetical protein